MKTRISFLDVLVLAVLIALLGAPGCGGKVPPALVTSQPTPKDLADVQRLAKNLAIGATTGLTLISETGALIDTLPIAESTKDKYDCAVLRLTGIDQPSPTTLRVCGPLQKLAETPLTKARVQLEQVTTCPSLRATTAVILGLVTPLIAQLTWGDSPVLGFSGRAIALAFERMTAFLQGGGECSPS